MSGSTEPNPLELEAQADDLEAEALRLRARAKRLRAETKIPPVAVAAVSGQMTCTEYAASRKISRATVSRLLDEGMPCLPVGSTVRIDPSAADEWRRARGRRATKAKERADKASEVELGSALARGGLRAVGA